MYICSANVANHSTRINEYMKADSYLIKLERFEQGLTQKDLAAKAGVGLSSVIKAERGGNITPRTHKKIKDALGL